MRVYVVTMRGFFFLDKKMRGSVPSYRKQSDQKCLRELTVVAEALFLQKSN